MPGFFNSVFLKNSSQTFYNKVIKKVENKGFQDELKAFEKKIQDCIASLKNEKDVEMKNLKDLIQEMKKICTRCVDSYTGNDADQKLLHRNICSISNEIDSIKLNRDLGDELDKLHSNIKSKPWYKNFKQWLMRQTETDDNLAKYAALIGMSYRFLSDLRKQLKYVQENSEETLEYAAKAKGNYPHPGFEEIESKEIKIFDVDNSGNPVFNKEDVQQTKMDFGDCWFLSTLRTLADKNPLLLSKCFKSYPEKGIWTADYGDISLRVYNIDIIGEQQYKKIINIKPNKFLKGVNYGRSGDIPVWPRVLELAAQSAFYLFDDFRDPKVKASIGEGYQEIFALRILGAKEIQSDTISFESKDNNKEIFDKLEKLNRITQGYTNWSITTASPENPRHAVTVTKFDLDTAEPTFYYFDQHWKPGKGLKSHKILGGKAARIFTISHMQF